MPPHGAKARAVDQAESPAILKRHEYFTWKLQLDEFGTLLRQGAASNAGEGRHQADAQQGDVGHVHNRTHALRLECTYIHKFEEQYLDSLLLQVHPHISFLAAPKRLALLLRLVEFALDIAVVPSRYQAPRH